MKKTLILIALIGSSFQIFSNEDAYVTYTGEVLQCNFNKGRDLDKVLEFVRNDWYELADSYPAPYEGNVVTPQLYDDNEGYDCLLYTSPSPRDRTRSRMPSSA